MSRLGTALFLAKQAAIPSLVSQQLREWEQQIDSPSNLIASREPIPPVSPMIEAQLQETLPGVDTRNLPRPSIWPPLLAMAALLTIGGVAYLSGKGEVKGRRK